LVNYVPNAVTPKFVKKYCNLAEIVTKALSEYCDDVREQRFPTDEQRYHMLPGEAEKFFEIMKG